MNKQTIANKEQRTSSLKLHECFVCGKKKVEEEMAYIKDGECKDCNTKILRAKHGEISEASEYAHSIYHPEDEQIY